MYTILAIIVHCLAFGICGAFIDDKDEREEFYSTGPYWFFAQMVWIGECMGKKIRKLIENWRAK